MKGYHIALAALLNVLMPCTATADDIQHGTIQFHGRVIDEYCTPMLQGSQLLQNCPARPVASNVKIEHVLPEEASRAAQTMDTHLTKDERQRRFESRTSPVLEPDAGTSVIQGRYLVTITLL